MVSKFLLLFTVAIAGAISGAVVAADNIGQGSGFSMYKARRLEGLIPYDQSKRVEIHQVMQRLGQLSQRPMHNEVVAQVESKLFPSWPLLTLVDNDNDLAADFFVYGTEEADGDLYGAFFALEDGGNPAWIVFPVGPVIDENKEFLFVFTHWVDQNSDGKLDLIILEGIDLDGSGLPEAGTSAWVMDDNFDGLVDGAQHCVLGNCTAIEIVNGGYNLRSFLGPGEESVVVHGEPFEDVGWLDRLFLELRAATAEVAR